MCSQGAAEQPDFGFGARLSRCQTALLGPASLLVCALSAMCEEAHL